MKGIAPDGVLLVDKGIAGGGIANALGNYLRQTWAEWHTTSLRADNPRQVAMFNKIKLEFDNYAGDTASFRSTMRSRLINEGFTTAEIAYVGL